MCTRRQGASQRRRRPGEHHARCSRRTERNVHPAPAGGRISRSQGAARRAAHPLPAVLPPMPHGVCRGRARALQATQHRRAAACAPRRPLPRAAAPSPLALVLQHAPHGGDGLGPGLESVDHARGHNHVKVPAGWVGGGCGGADGCSQGLPNQGPKQGRCSPAHCWEQAASPATRARPALQGSPLVRWCLDRAAGVCRAGLTACGTAAPRQPGRATCPAAAAGSWSTPARGRDALEKMQGSASDPSAD